MRLRFVLLSSLILSCALWLSVGLALADSPEKVAPPAGELTVIVLGLESDDGRVLAALFDSLEAFDAPAEPVRKAMLEIKGRAAEIRWAGLPVGEYALRMVHDENDNGEIDTNWVGIPTEPFGFSNNPVSRFGPPGFDEAKFQLGAEPMTIQVKLEEI